MDLVFQQDRLTIPFGIFGNHIALQKISAGQAFHQRLLALFSKSVMTRLYLVF